MSDYFNQNAVGLRITEGSDTVPGFRRAQRGAAHAIGAHFTLSREAALISMPTGTGKTAVLMMAPFLLKANRALVITPSRMVREQIAEEFGTLQSLKDLGVLPLNTPAPSVRSVESRIIQQEAWADLEQYDVVITTPMGSSPALEGIPAPPPGLFDLLLIDEAHHSPARTWSALIDAFPPSRQILFTATPFRRDRRQLPGRFVYEFPLREAVNDGVFGTIEFVGCTAEDGVSNDVIIARRAESVYREDRAQGFDHRLMVRTDSRTRAMELRDVYAANTGLQLAIVHGQHTLRHVRQRVAQLRDGTLDGIICVDMFGEGFNLPQLKIAAIHSPHRSLSVTLQFIGRFARTGGERLGTAKFIAVPAEIDAETQVLYQEGAVWLELVTNLSDSRVSSERRTREQLRTFSLADPVAHVDGDIGLAIIKPWYHSKIFQVSGSVNLNQDITFASGTDVVRRFHSDDLSCAVYLCQSTKKPRWVDTPAVNDVEHDLFVVYYDAQRRYLFINASEKTEDSYSHIAEQLVDGVFLGITTSRISRALRQLNQPSFYSVGMKSRLFGNQVESYRIIAGSHADGAVSNTDSQLFDRGHLFGGGDTAEGRVTLGISTLSKVWSNRSGFVPEFVAWCQIIGEHLDNAAPVVTGSRIDILSTGEEVTEIPTAVIGATWHESIYKLHPIFVHGGDSIVRRDITQLEFRAIPERTTRTTAVVELQGFDTPVEIAFSINTVPRYRVGANGNDIRVHHGSTEGTLEQYLNGSGLHLYLADFSRLFGNELFRSNINSAPLDPACLHPRDWRRLGVDITREFGPSPNGTSIHAFLTTNLSSSAHDVVIYDHRSGEIGDFIAFQRTDRTVVCRVFHCKGSGESTPGNRVGDAYEVVGQVVKSVSWSKSPTSLLERITRRLATGSTIVKGDLRLLEEILDELVTKQFQFVIVLVQPGISAGSMEPHIATLLAAAHDYVMATTGHRPEMWISQ